MYQRYVITNCGPRGEPEYGAQVRSDRGVRDRRQRRLQRHVDRGRRPQSVGPTWGDNPAPAASRSFCDYATDPGDDPRQRGGHRLGRHLAHLQLRAGERRNAVEVRVLAGGPEGLEHRRRLGRMDVRHADRNPDVFGNSWGAARAVPGVVTAGTVAGASAVRRAASARAPRSVLGPLRFAGRMVVSRGLRLRRMRVVVERTLFEHGRREELARSSSGRRLRPFALRHGAAGIFTAAGPRGPRVRLRLRSARARPAGAQVALRLARVRTRDVRALCTVLPAGVSRAGRPLELETRLRLSDGATGRDHPAPALALRARPQGRVHRASDDRTAAADRPSRTGRAPADTARADDRAPRHRPRHRHQPPRARPSRVVSSLWHLRITGTAGGPAQTVGVKELRARRSRTVRLRLPVPDAARRRACVRVTVGADSARPATARRCVRIANSPRFTG